MRMRGKEEKSGKEEIKMEKEDKTKVRKRCLAEGARKRKEKHRNREREAPNLLFLLFVSKVLSFFFFLIFV